MFASRIQRASTELQVHRSWLETFVANRRLSTGRVNSRTSTPRTLIWSRSYSDVHTILDRRAVNRGKTKARWSARQKQGAKPAQGINLEAISAREDLNKAIKESDIENVIASYSLLPARKPLTSREFTALSQCIHHCLRQELYKPEAVRERDKIDALVAAASQLVSDVKKGRLLASTPAYVHILCIFRESGRRDAGIEFWQWLEQQDEDHTSTEVYGAAIELLAIDGSSLDELEQLYQDALTRFPGTFSAYHLSPMAIVPDREQELAIKDLPLPLLKSISFARLLRGDSRQAYLALDTAFRLVPTSVSARMLIHFLDERPLSESYTVFALARRAGIQLPINQHKALLARLKASCADLELTAAHVASLRAMLTILYLQLGSSGSLTSSSVSEFVIFLTQMLRIPTVTSLEAPQLKQVVDIVLDLIRKSIALFARYSAVPTLSAYNSIITNVAGYGRSTEVLDIVVADMTSLGLQPNQVTRRSFLTAAGLLNNSSLVEKVWKEMVAARNVEGFKPDAVDLRVLIKAAGLASMNEFAKNEWAAHKQHVPPEHVETIEDLLEESEVGGDHHSKKIVALDLKELLGGLDALQADLKWLDEHTKDQLAVQDFSIQDVPMTLLSPEGPLAIPDTDLRRIYDDLSTEPHPATTLKDRSEGENISRLGKSFYSLRKPKPLAPAGPSPKSSITNVTFGQLRFESWKAFNYLLWLAEKHDAQYNRIVDIAIAKGTRPPMRTTLLLKQEMHEMQHFGLSAGSGLNLAQQQEMSHGVSDDVRHQIMRLRGPDIVK